MPVVMTVSFDDKGNIAKVEDGNGKKVKKLSKQEMEDVLKKKKILEVKSMVIVRSNPCVIIGGYQVCW